jgi:predicted transcriptional regulator
LNAIVFIFATIGGKEVISFLSQHKSASSTDISGTSTLSKATISFGLYTLEEKGIVISKPLFNSGRYIRMYRLNPKCRRIVEKFKSAL